MDIRKPTWVVLEGGGAKGSYTCGVLTEMERFQNNCVAVAGTSAGALNAVALSTHQIDKAKEAWESLTIWKILTLAGDSRWSRIPQLIYGMLVALPCVFINVMGSAFSHRDHFLRVHGAPVRLLTLCFVFLNVGLAAAIAWPLMLLTQQWGSEVLGLLVGVTLVHSSYNSSRHHAAIGKAAVASGILMSLTLLVASLFKSSLASFAVGLLIVYSVALITCAVGAFLIEIPSRAVATIGRTHLVAVLRSFLSEKPALPCFVTIASLAPTLDSNRTMFVPEYRHYSDVRPPESYHLQPNHEHVAIYRDISRLPVDEALRTILASTSLPLGIAEPVRLRGIYFEDGGLADNCPLLPLLLSQQARQAFVVMLSPPASASLLETAEGQAIAKAALRAKLVDTLDKRLRRASYRQFRQRMGLRPGEDVIPIKAETPSEPIRLAQAAHAINEELAVSIAAVLERFDQIEMVIIAPGRSLGNFLTGTLAFWPPRVRALFDRGVNDARSILGTFCQDPAVMTGARAPRSDGA